MAWRGAAEAINMATVRALRGMKQEREDENFPVMRVYIYFVEQLTDAVRGYGAPGSAAAAASRRRLRFLRNYFRAQDIAELQHWKDTLLRTAVDLAACRADGSAYLHDVAVPPRVRLLRAMCNDIAGGTAHASDANGDTRAATQPPLKPVAIPSYLFPTTKPSLRMDMSKALRSLEKELCDGGDASKTGHAAALKSSTKLSFALCNALEALCSVLQTPKEPSRGTRFDGRSGEVVSVSFFDADQQRMAVLPHIKAVEEQVASSAPPALLKNATLLVPPPNPDAGASSDAGGLHSARLDVVEALNRVVDDVVRVWELDDDDGILSKETSSDVQRPSTSGGADQATGRRLPSASGRQHGDQAPTSVINITAGLKALRSTLAPADFASAFEGHGRSKFDELIRTLEATALERVVVARAAEIVRRHPWSLVHVGAALAALQRFVAIADVPTGSGCSGLATRVSRFDGGVGGLLTLLERHKFQLTWLRGFVADTATAILGCDAAALANCTREFDSWEHLQREQQLDSEDDDRAACARRVAQRVRRVRWVIEVLDRSREMEHWFVSRV